MDKSAHIGAADSPVLDEIGVAAYQWAVRNGGLDAADPDRCADELGVRADELTAAIDTLNALHLLTPMAGSSVLLPNGPDAAIAALLGPTEDELRRAETELSRRRRNTEQVRSALSALSAVYFEARRQRNHDEAVDSLADKFAVRALLAELGANCRVELMACQPGGGRPPAALADALPRDLAMLERGVRIRSLYQHTARFHAPTQAYVEAVVEAGSEIRTLVELPGRMIVFDRQVAFLPHLRQPGGAVIVREESIVAHLCQSFEQAWANASEYRTGPLAAHESAEDIKRLITTLLGAGLKDDVIAKRAGLSVRSCRQHIAELLERLGARSRFQAGVIAARSGLLPPARPGALATETGDGVHGR
ncbi:hypothetical protein ACIQI7_05945 [Kitasatospora sp. NPDC092039]|uniref:hypothetical protein n=1 Tax=Kitasatospora sp. NPDC092039 TaxID=3364086 RepID=UPI0037F4DB4E